MKISITEKSALIIVDVQNDFLSRGVLLDSKMRLGYKKHSINIDFFNKENLLVFAARDKYHKKSH